MQPVTFAATADGYAATVHMPRAGVWELRLQATRGTDTFLRTLRVETTLADASAPAVPDSRDGP
jgi:nitrogen fixation protein FixH